jgi:hypothetical protein
MSRDGTPIVGYNDINFSKPLPPSASPLPRAYQPFQCLSCFIRLYFKAFYQPFALSLFASFSFLFTSSFSPFISKQASRFVIN